MLVYLIDKTGKVHHNYKKIAFHISYSHDILAHGFNMFNTADNEVDCDYIFNGGWREDIVMRVTTLYKILFYREKKLKKSKDFVQSFSEKIQSLNFETLNEHLNLLEQHRKLDYISTIQEQINKLVNNLNNTDYAGYSKTKS